MIFSLLLTIALDMSLPEFQPADISGNYLVSEYSTSGNDAVLVPIDEVSINALSEDGDAVVDAIQDFQADNNAYWEQFLADYESNYFKKNIGTYLSPNPFWIGSTGGITSQSVNTYKFVYCEVKKGHTYTLNGVLYPLSSGSGTYRSGFVPSLTEPGTSVLSFHNFYSNDPNGYTFTSPIDGFYCLCVNSTDTFRGFNLIETLTYREDITEILHTVDDTFDKIALILTVLSGCEFILLFMAVVPFLTKIVDKLMNKKED